MTPSPAGRRLPKLLTPDIEVEEEAGGGFLVRSRTPLEAPDSTIVDWLRRWAALRPNHVALVEPDEGASLTWGELFQQSRSVAQALLNRKLSSNRPVMILSGNSIAHAILSLGATVAGVPVIPVSVAYSLASGDHHQLLDIAQLGTPGLVFAEDAQRFAAALSALEPLGAEIVAEQSTRGATTFADLIATAATPEVDEVELGPDTVVKILMTSGSTGSPKGVINTQRMLTSNQQMLAQVWPFADLRPQMLVDWLPWSHTFGGNHNFNLVLRTGGTMVIAKGKPQGAEFDPVLALLRSWSPTFHLDVPAGWALLARELEWDVELRQRFFSQLDGMFFAAAPLPESTWKRLDRVAREHLGVRPWLTTGWGTTETSPMSTTAHFASERADLIGVPAPGVELRLAPVGDRFELRVRGPHVTPGYHRDDDATRAAFDEDGFYRTGDAGELIDRDDPAQGLRFRGRLAEDFKLASGTWVHVGPLRSRALAAAEGLLSQAVVAGDGADDVTLLAWLDLDVARRFVGADETREALNRHGTVHEAIRSRIAAHNAAAGGTSRQVARVALLDDPPSPEQGEITDKGYINARTLLRNRPMVLVRALANEGPTLIVIDPGQA